MNMRNRHHRHHHRRHGRKWFMFVPLMIAFVLAKAALVMVIWNALIPDLFHLPALEYLQALGLMVLAKLFVGFGGGSRGFGHWRHRHWARLTPEERHKIRDEMRKHRGGGLSDQTNE